METIKRDVSVLNERAQDLAAATGASAILAHVYAVKGEPARVRLDVKGAANSCAAMEIKERLEETVSRMQADGEIATLPLVAVDAGRPITLNRPEAVKLARA